MKLFQSFAWLLCKISLNNKSTCLVILWFIGNPGVYLVPFLINTLQECKNKTCIGNDCQLQVLSMCSVLSAEITKGWNSDMKKSMYLYLIKKKHSTPFPEISMSINCSICTTMYFRAAKGTHFKVPKSVVFALFS